MTYSQTERIIPVAEPRIEHRRLDLAVKDIVGGLLDWRIWMMLATADIRGRYRRSRFGQLWLTLSMAITIMALALVYSTLFKQDLRAYLPFLSAGIILWGFLAGMINESAQTFIEAEGYLRNVAMPKSMFVYRVLLRNLIVFAHNIILMPLVLLVLWVPVGWVILMVIPALLLIMANGLWMGLILGTLSARFRDMPQIIASIVQVMFFISPIIWRPEQLQDRLPFLTLWNPFASFIAIFRDPLLGQMPNLQNYLTALAVTAVGFLIAVPFFARFRSRIVFYL